MHDETEAIRRNEVSAINSNPGSREALVAQYGEVWDTNGLRRDFEVTGFTPKSKCVAQLLFRTT